MMVNGEPIDLERLAVDMAKRGKLVRLQVPEGFLVFEPGTGNLLSVALNDVADLAHKVNDTP